MERPYHRNRHGPLLRILPDGLCVLFLLPSTTYWPTGLHSERERRSPGSGQDHGHLGNAFQYGPVVNTVRDSHTNALLILTPFWYATACSMWVVNGQNGKSGSTASKPSPPSSSASPSPNMTRCYWKRRSRTGWLNHSFCSNPSSTPGGSSERPLSSS